MDNILQSLTGYATPNTRALKEESVQLCAGGAKVCPLCHADIEKMVADLKDIKRPGFDAAYEHVMFDCPQCKIIIKNEYTNEWGNWKHE